MTLHTWHTTRLPEFLITIGSCLLGVGMIGWLFFSVQPSLITAAATPLVHVQTSGEARPIALSHFALGTIAIEEGQVLDNEWSLSATTAVHWSASSLPGYGSNIVIYGHNTKGIFAALPKVVIGDLLSVQTAGGVTHTYRVVDRRIVDPDRVDLVQSTAEETLTVYTCTGILDSRRFVLLARRAD